MNEIRNHVWHWYCTRELPDVHKIDSIEPLICYAYGAGRRSRVGPFDRELLELERDGIFLEDTSLLNAEEWLLQLDYSASKPSRIQKRQRNRLGMVKEILIRVLPGVSDIRISEPDEQLTTPTAEFETPYGWVHLRDLGYGYRTMIAWIVDLARRMFERYPRSSDPLAEPAVVLVDEIDLHLHPKWQRELIGFLTERFPNTQFIATAHSPLIVQAASERQHRLAKARR